MTPDESLTLMMALVADGPLRSRDIARGLYCTPTRALRIANSLLATQALSHPRYNHWVITEKGRIACALLMVKDPSLHAAFFG